MSAVSPVAWRPTRALARTLPKLSRCGRSLSTAERGCTGPVRNFGPPRSISIRIGHPSALAARRTFFAMLNQSAAPSCAQLMRAISMPPSISWRTRPKSVAASIGSVTMIRTFLSAREGPRRTAVCRSSRSRLLRSPASLLVFSVGCPCPSRRDRMATTLSMLAMTLDSARPNEETPKWSRLFWSGRRSLWRNAR
ncbi:hypothetical protein GALL_487390 [mine drainage metagenome]|uniref:Uncharacterized protein n=1 Tax=mine drainage metagenome TaxID=410659 RepID=A0A1J5PEK8_9ZZZZ